MAKYDSQSVIDIKNRAKKIYGRSQLKDSIFEIAQDYYQRKNEFESALTDTSSQAVDKNPKSANNAFEKDQSKARSERLEHALSVINEIIEHCCDDEQLSHKKVARHLTVLYLASQQSHVHCRRINTQNKPLYRALLSLLLLENVMKNKLINHQFIDQCYKNNPSLLGEPFRSQVVVPVMLVSMCCDIGNQHPEAITILSGEDDQLDPHRILDRSEREQLLRINFTQTLHYLNEGLGARQYVGNCKQQRAEFNQAEVLKQQFIEQLVKGLFKPGQGIGNLIKIPQIYVSVVLNTKQSVTSESIPNIYQLLDKHAEKGSLNQQLVECMRHVTGDFPMGYGLAYIPKGPEHHSLNQYEYAIVTQLYPQQGDTPICRTITRNMTFNSSGTEIHLTPEYNLYFNEARKKLKTMSKRRLEEIIKTLWSNFDTRPEYAQILPRCWQPYEYFSEPKFQNLWNTVERISN